MFRDLSKAEQQEVVEEYQTTKATEGVCTRLEEKKGSPGSTRNVRGKGGRRDMEKDGGLNFKF
jgi:hypothetical protein